jgi:hypothetical protein
VFGCSVIVVAMIHFFLPHLVVRVRAVGGMECRNRYFRYIPSQFDFFIRFPFGFHLSTLSLCWAAQHQQGDRSKVEDMSLIEHVDMAIESLYKS